MKEMRAPTGSPEMVEIKECRKRMAGEIGDMDLRKGVNVD